MKFNRGDVTEWVHGEERTGYANTRGKKNPQQKKIKPERWGFHWFRMVTASHQLRRKIKSTKG